MLRNLVSAKQNLLEYNNTFARIYEILYKYANDRLVDDVKTKSFNESFKFQNKTTGSIQADNNINEVEFMIQDL